MIPPLQHEAIPALPQDLTGMTEQALIENKEQLGRIALAIQNQLSQKNVALATERMRLVEFHDIRRWRGQATHALTAVNQEISRVRVELTRRVAVNRDANAAAKAVGGRKKGKRSPFMAALLDFAKATVLDNVSDRACDAARRLATVIEEETEA